MAVKIIGIGDQIDAVIRKQSSKQFVKYIPKLKGILEFIGLDWRTIVRDNLNVLVPKPWDASTPRNLSMWPKRRSGKLYYSILKPDVRVLNRSPSFKKRRGTASVEFSISNRYGPIARSGYGDTLNQRRDFDTDGEALGVKPFAGWKVRADRILFDLISSRV